jgi:hypothetical protein
MACRTSHKDPCNGRRPPTPRLLHAPPGPRRCPGQNRRPSDGKTWPSMKKYGLAAVDLLASALTVAFLLLAGLTADMHYAIDGSSRGDLSMELCFAAALVMALATVGSWGLRITGRAPAGLARGLDPVRWGLAGLCALALGYALMSAAVH